MALLTMPSSSPASSTVLYTQCKPSKGLLNVVFNNNENKPEHLTTRTEALKGRDLCFVHGRESQGPRKFLAHS